MAEQSRVDLIDSATLGLKTKANVGQEQPSRNDLLCPESVHTIIELCQWGSNELPKCLGNPSKIQADSELVWVSFFYGSNAWILTGETEWRLSLRLLKQMTRSLPIVGRWRAWERYEKDGGLGGIPRMSCRKLEKVSSPTELAKYIFYLPKGKKKTFNTEQNKTPISRFSHTQNLVGTPHNKMGKLSSFSLRDFMVMIHTQGHRYLDCV